MTHNRDDWSGEVDALRTYARDAAGAAGSSVSRPSLSSVLVELDHRPSGPVPAAFQFGFQQLLTGWGLGPRLKACFVEVRLHPRAVRVTSSGTYGRSQFKTLASLPGFAFPPATLDLTQLRVGPLQVLDILRARPLEAASADLGDVQLSLYREGERLAWRALQEVPSGHLRTLLLDAADAQVVYEKVDGGVAP